MEDLTIVFLAMTIILAIALLIVARRKKTANAPIYTPPQRKKEFETMVSLVYSAENWNDEEETALRDQAFNELIVRIERFKIKNP